MCFLVSTTELSQLLKLPKLIEHYAQHKERNQGLSFIAFLSLHYMVDHGMDADYKEDMQLPFKTFHTVTISGFTGFITPHTNSIPSQTFVYVKEKPLLINDEISELSVFNAIWHPPALS